MPAFVRSKSPAATITPTHESKPPREPNSPADKIYVEGFDYVEHSGPNQCVIADSMEEITKMVGYMGDEPAATSPPTSEEEYIPKNGDKEIDFQTGEVKIYVEGQGFVPEE